MERQTRQFALPSTIHLAALACLALMTLALPAQAMRPGAGGAIQNAAAYLSLDGVSDACYDITVANGVVSGKCDLRFEEELPRGIARELPGEASWQSAGGAVSVPVAYEQAGDNEIVLMFQLPLDALLETGPSSELMLMLIDPATGEVQEAAVPLSIDFSELPQRSTLTGVEPDEIDVAAADAPFEFTLAGEGLSENGPASCASRLSRAAPMAARAASTLNTH